MQINKFKIFIFFSLFISLNYSLKGQFIGGVTVGLNAAQINGDELVGFNKAGLHAGLIGGYKVNEKLGINLELLYSQRGSSSRLFDNSDNQAIVSAIKTNYVEIPIYATYNDWLDGDYYKIKAHGGFSYGNLISAEQSNLGETELTNAFEKNNISWLLGVSFYVNSQFALTFRYTRSINKLFDNEKNQNVNNNSLIGFFLTFRAEYYF